MITSPFHSARLKLTGWYLLIIVTISMSFSLVIFRASSNELERLARSPRFRLEQQFINADLIKETKDRLIIFLIGINGTIFTLSGALGYFLAGRTLDPIQEMMADQNRFISDASHELRTPLTSLKTSMEVYLRGKNPDLQETKDLISESITEVNKLQALSDSLLQLAQYEQPQDNSKFEKLTLTSILEKALLKVKPLAHKKDIHIITNLEEVTLQANSYSLLELFVILLDNAIKYSFEHKKILITTKRSNNEAVIEIKDFGVGIAKKDLPHIFDRFYRTDTARSKETGGYGLGLSIAQHIATMHHGSISVKSKINTGSTFILRFPIV